MDRLPVLGTSHLKMPLGLFTNKFSPKKGAPRKSPSLSNLNIDASERTTEFDGPIKLKLGSNEILFDGGEWVSETGGGGVSSKELLKIRRQNKQLTEENNLLKIKIELLLDMLSERTAQVHLQDNEIEQLKKLSKRR
jgi:hypothetical protein